MKFPARPELFLTSFALLAFVALAAAPSARSQQAAVDFNGSTYVGGSGQFGDLELARTPKRARSATSALYEFGPAAPKSDYQGPAFSLGYEVRASEPSDLTVAPEKAVVEDNFANGKGQVNDTIAVTAYGNWPDTGTYSVAAVIVFPISAFTLESFEYSSLNWTNNKSYNDKLRHRWVVQTGGKYYVSVPFLGRPGRRAPDQPSETMQAARTARNFDQWVEYDPSKSMFANLDAPRVILGKALDEVTAVGFYMDSLDFNGAGVGGRQWQLRLIQFAALGEPARARR